MTRSADAAVESFASALDLIRATPFRERPGEPRPDTYYKVLLAEPGLAQREAVRKRIAYARDVFRVARVDPAGLDLLEVGSGFGIGLVAWACIGAGSVLGVELVPWQVEWARSWLEALPPEISARVQVVEGDAAALPVADESADAVISLEAISHYYDYRPFLDEAWRALRAGGVLIISDGNNGRNPRIRSHTERLWRAQEADGRHGSAALADDSPWRLVEKRERIIRDHAPTLADEAAHELALTTAGMRRGEIVAAVDAYLRDGVRPESPYRPGQPTVDPEHEMVLERLFDPYDLAREIAERGFRVRVRGHWAGASRWRPVRWTNDVLAALSPLTIGTARGFRIAAYKPRRG